MNTHRTLVGDWEVCEAPGSCGLLFHMEASVAELSATPLELLLPLFEIVQPPHSVERGLFAGEPGIRKEWLNSEGEPHRDYDLPAYISPTGMAWHQGGRFHRERGPAQVFENGAQVWWWQDDVHRADGPARILDDGSTEWWWRGSRVYDLSLVPQWAPYLTRWGEGG